MSSPLPLLFGFAWLVTLPCLLQAQDLIRYEFRSEQPDSQLEEILYLSLAVELAEAGFSSTRETQAGSHTLAVEYSLISGELALQFSLYPAAEPDPSPAVTELRLPLDYTFDAEIAAAIKRLLALSDLTRSGAEPSDIGGLFPDSPEPVPIRRPIRPTRWTGTAAAGGMVFFGELSELVRQGATGTLLVAWVLSKDTWTTSWGVRVTSTRGFNNVGVTGGTFLLSTVGIDGEWGTEADQPYWLSGLFSAGTALLTVAGESRLLNKLVPYADAGVRADFSLPGGFALGSDIRFLLAFDGSLWIMGAVPVILLRKEF